MSYSILLAALIVSVSADYITISGTFHCDRNPNAAVYIELIEKEKLSEDVLNWKLVSANEKFEIVGYDDEFFGIHPCLKIRNNCNEEQVEQVYDFGRRNGEVVVHMGDIELQHEYQ
ncbi:unnamed protein product [Cylicostephanus goldi]|uniref:Transthyretin/hydroxyisourate hydrolase domain-containing protein n=1 Tax=Cylicostephanus goldi TaxID=71465 RepID=A0A3P6QR67_CYLGO|nr:unnamed protein product [Cylicostephanus goldi]